MAALDQQVFHAINAMAGRVPALDVIMIVFAQALLWLAPAVLALLWLLPGRARRRRRLTAVWTGMALILAVGLTQLPAEFVYRPRPFVALEGQVTVLIPSSPSPSWPAGHPAAAAAMAAVLTAYSRVLGYGFWLVTLAIMLARVYVGVHFPSDVVDGALVGWAAGAFVRANRDALGLLARRVVRFVERLVPL